MIVPNKNFLLQGAIEKYPRFEIHRRVFQDYHVLKTYNAERFCKWTNWSIVSKLPGGDMDFAITQLNKLITESKNSKITLEYALINNYPNFSTEIEYYNHIQDLIKAQINDRK